MSPSEYKADLHEQLRDARAVLLWKLDRLSEYDARRPLTAHGTNLLGLVKHLAGCEIGYFGSVFDRPFPDPPPWLAHVNDPTVDMWVPAEQTRQEIVELYQRACGHSDETIANLPLDYPGNVPTWPEQRRTVTLHHILVHMVAETSRHAGHADILRENIDNNVGRHPDRPGLPTTEGDYWRALHGRIEDAARDAAPVTPVPHVTLRSMTDAEYETATTIREAESLSELTKHMPTGPATARIRRATNELLPNGRHTAGHHLIVAVDTTNTPIGHAWLGPDPRATTATTDCAWLHDLFVYPPFRRRGYGLAMLIAIEGLAKTRGAKRLALNVVADNTAAQHLYQHAGYALTSQYLHKRLLIHVQPSSV